MDTSKNRLPYLFGWSTVHKDFDGKFTLATSSSLTRFDLRQRYNSRRKIDLYGVLLTEEEAEVLNQEWDNKDIPNEQLKQQLDELGARVIRKG